ncbi:hypothetical protein MRS44_003689 [Fusarium solani]|uniref:uncharacterized protein n=1 Tax=Fusarium solani TaxID=169388 RepID=UPI0032C45164|nr:hypothetical protein MRS44_003689 [Fusarium solani]
MKAALARVAIHTEQETLRGIRSPTAISEADIKSLKYHNMHGVLRAIGLNEGQQRFIEVWRRFDGPAQEPKNSPAEALDIMAKLARDLVSGITAGLMPSWLGVAMLSTAYAACLDPAKEWDRQRLRHINDIANHI